MKRKVFFTRRRSLARVATSRARVWGRTSRDARLERARGSCVGVRRVWVNSMCISHYGSFVIHRYFFGFGFERESVVLPIEFSSSFGTRRAVGACVLGDTLHRAPSSSCVVVVVVVSRPRPRLGLIFHPSTRRSCTVVYPRRSTFNVQRASRRAFSQLFLHLVKKNIHVSTNRRRRDGVVDDAEGPRRNHPR